MLKKEFIELVKIAVNGGTPPAKSEGKFHDVVIDRYIGMAYNELVSTTKDRKILDQFAINFKNVPVLYDNDLGLKYSELPSGLINTPYAMGVRLISPMKDQSYPFLIRPNGSQPTFYHLDVSYVLVNNIARIDGQRAYYDQIQEGITKVLMKILSRFEDIGDNDDIEMPGGKDGAAFQMTIQLMGVLMQTPENYKNNNNSNTK